MATSIGSACSELTTARALRAAVLEARRIVELILLVRCSGEKLDPLDVEDVPPLGLIAQDFGKHRLCRLAVGEAALGAALLIAGSASAVVHRHLSVT
jgi:hypothetical protein